MSTFKPGDRFHHYVVGRLLGAGAHAEVHEIVHPHTGAAFAIKVMHLANVNDARMVRRALAEAKGTYGIDHANVIKVLDFNCEESGLVWMRTELCAGETLGDLIARVGPLSLRFALTVAIEAAHGLAAAHEAQIIHRDVKPANLMYVTATRSLKVIDFSIAKIFPDGLQTTVGRVGLGTPAFMGPEQLGAAPPTPGFDVYGLGMTLWVMLAGRHPFNDVLGNSRKLVHMQFTEMPPLLADVAGLPPEVDRVVRRAVAKDPLERYQTMRELARALTDLRAWVEAEAQEGRLVLAVPPGEPPPPCDARSRRAYAAPQEAPAGDEAPPAPPARVMIAEIMPPSGSGTLAGTVELATLPIGIGARMPRSAELADTADLPAEPRHVDTPVPAVRPEPRRLPWRAVALASLGLSLASLGIVAILHRRAPASRDPEPPSRSIASPMPPPPVPSTEPAVLAVTSAPVTAPPPASSAVSVAPRLPRAPAPSAMRPASNAAPTPSAAYEPNAAPAPVLAPSAAPAPAPSPSNPSRRLFGVED